MSWLDKSTSTWIEEWSDLDGLVAARVNPGADADLIDLRAAETRLWLRKRSKLKMAG